MAKITIPVAVFHRVDGLGGPGDLTHDPRVPPSQGKETEIQERQNITIPFQRQKNSQKYKKIVNNAKIL